MAQPGTDLASSGSQSGISKRRSTTFARFDLFSSENNQKTEKKHGAQSAHNLADRILTRQSGANRTPPHRSSNRALASLKPAESLSIKAFSSIHHITKKYPMKTA
ncbi:hypothetical protein [Burkholderia sp. BCC0405]|uniref:hypothetical protein n=1 Tax=Burkholderia sp. BCC0405 TaxID=2676298 RepID=UPI00158ACAB0|nr:hypothetical protein [Burkholderia sp. BCC0405]